MLKGAAEFWPQAGADSRRALRLAERNHEVRPTRRANELVARAALAGAGEANHAVVTKLEGVA